MTAATPSSRFRIVAPLASAVLGTALLAPSSAFAAAVITAGSKTANSGSVSDSSSSTGPNEDVLSFSSATFGVLHAYSSSVSRPGGFTPSTSITASFRDDWTFLAPVDRPELNGTIGTVTVRFTIDGTLQSLPNGKPSYANSNFAEARYMFGAHNPTNYTKAEKHYGDGRVSGSIFLGLEQTQQLSFTFGQTLTDVKLGIMSYASSSGGTGTSSSTADLSHTATWGGFAEVRDNNGNVVANYSFSSASGTNYVQAIPEPDTTTLLVLSGLAFNAIRVRRRNREG